MDLPAVSAPGAAQKPASRTPTPAQWPSDAMPLPTGPPTILPRSYPPPARALPVHADASSMPVRTEVPAPDIAPSTSEPVRPNGPPLGALDEPAADMTGELDPPELAS